MSFYSATDQSILAEIGDRIRRRRLDRNLSQGDVAERAGLDRTTVGALEREGRATLLSFVQVLRALDALDELDGFLPAQGPSPLELAKLQGKQRQRASRKRSADDPDREDPQW